MKIMAQKSIHHISLIDLNKSKTSLQPENVEDSTENSSKKAESTEGIDESPWDQKEVIKAIKDKKIYKLKKLENGLKVLMISDEEG